MLLIQKKKAVLLLKKSATALTPKAPKSRTPLSSLYLFFLFQRERLKILAIFLIANGYVEGPQYLVSHRASVFSCTALVTCSWWLGAHMDVRSLGFVYKTDAAVGVSLSKSRFGLVGKKV